MEKASKQLPSIKLLQVEDNPGDALFVHTLLDNKRHSNYQLTRASSLREALNEISNSNYHVILLDLSLPDSQGLETLRSVRTSAPNKPIVVLSGNNEDEMAAAALEAGAHHYLVKDKVNADMIVMSLHHAISQSSSAIRQYKKFNLNS